MITMIFLPRSSARHGVDSCSAIIPWRAASFAASSWADASGCENLKPCAKAGADRSATSAAASAHARRNVVVIEAVDPFRTSRPNRRRLAQAIDDCPREKSDFRRTWRNATGTVAPPRRASAVASVQIGDVVRQVLDVVVRQRA